MEFRLRALTDIWTGGVEGKPDKLHLTGIKGSIRWWYEALIRGLGGNACDPSDEKERHTLDLKKFKKLREDGKTEQEALDSLICPACQMFGCTNWGGKFILRVKDNNGKLITHQIEKDKDFILEFIERKKFSEIEKKLIKGTIKLIVEYGAIGAKTVLKPSDVPTKNTKQWHLDFGIINYQNSFNILKINLPTLTGEEKNKNHHEWPDLKNFWFIKDDYIKRNDHNRIVNRCISGRGVYENPDEMQIFLGGFIEDEKEYRNDLPFPQYRSASKKIFSFHGGASGISRCFGYARNIAERDNIIKEIKTILDAKKEIYTIKTGMEVLNEL